MDLPPGFDLSGGIHGENERIPVEAVRFGARAMYRLLEWYEI
jgi:hypothetical protein